MELLTIEQIRKQNYQLTKDVDLEIKSYLSLPLKQLIIKNILSICTIEDENTGIKKIDFSLKQFAYEITLVGQYSNLDVNTKNIVKLYDELKEHGIVDTILDKIPESEKEFIANVLDKEIEQKIKLDNSLEVIVANALTKIIDHLPDQKGMEKLIKLLPKQINKIDPEKMSYLSSAINWNNGKAKE
jgi:hypothetical protein